MSEMIQERSRYTELPHVDYYHQRKPSHS